MGGSGRALAHPHAERAAADLEILQLIGLQTLQQLDGEGVRIGAELLGIGHYAAPFAITSEALCPPKPIEFDIEIVTCFLRATFGT